MTHRFVIGLGLVFAFLILFAASSRSTDATTFGPSLGKTTLSTTALSGNPDALSGFSFLEPGSQFGAAIGYTDTNFTIAGDGAITNGKVVGFIESTAKLAVLNSQFCGLTSLTVQFIMREGDTSTTDTIRPVGPPSGAGRLANLVEDNRGASPPEGIYLSSDASIDSADTYLLQGVAAGQEATSGTLTAFPTNTKYVDNNGNSKYDEDSGVPGSPGVTGFEPIYLDTGATSGQVDGTDTLLLGDVSLINNGDALTAFDADEKFLDSTVNSTYDGSPPNLLQDYLDATPLYNNTVFTPAAGPPALVPHARYAGDATVSQLKVVLQFVIFNDGDLLVLPNGDTSVAALGAPSVTILQDPVGAPSKTILDFCSPLFTEVNVCGKTDDNEGNNGGGGSSGSCDVGGSSQTRITSPGAARTVQNTLQAFSQRDADNDGIETGLDPCNLSDSSSWDPRAASNPGNSDADSDALSDDCDPTLNTFDDDEDGDFWLNRIDNCATTRNGDGSITSPVGIPSFSVNVDDTTSFSLANGGDVIKIGAGTQNEETRTITGKTATTLSFGVGTTKTHIIGDLVANQYTVTANANQGQNDQDILFPASTPDRGPRGDAIGRECESSGETNGGPGGPDGHYHRTALISRNCIGGTDADSDGVCAGGAGLTDPNDSNIDSDGDNKPGGVCGSAQGGESNGLDPLCRGINTCLDGINNDLDFVGGVRPLIDLADPDCFGIDTIDNCISVANAPKAGFTQADGDMDGLGDACDSSSDSDGDGEPDSIEIHVGTNPSVAACSSVGGADNEFVDGKPQDLNDDGNISGADLDRIAAVIGTAVDAGPPQINMGPVGRQRLRVDMRPLPGGDNLVTGADLDAVAAVIGTSC